MLTYHLCHSARSDASKELFLGENRNIIARISLAGSFNRIPDNHEPFYPNKCLRQAQVFSFLA